MTAICDGSLEELNGVVEAMLAHYTELDAGLAREIEHGACGGEIGGHRLLHQDVLSGFLPGR
jgi:hypothetical protein